MFRITCYDNAACPKYPTKQIHLCKPLSTALARRIVAGSGIRTASALHIVVTIPAIWAIDI